jgi:hypothetical protein
MEELSRSADWRRGATLDSLATKIELDRVRVELLHEIDKFRLEISCQENLRTKFILAGLIGMFIGFSIGVVVATIRF